MTKADFVKYHVKQFLAYIKARDDSEDDWEDDTQDDDASDWGDDDFIEEDTYYYGNSDY